jgi:Mn-containing catalase
MKAFTAALESLGKPQFSIGAIPPTPGLVDQYFNDSTGVNEMGDSDVRGPWNQGDDWQFVEAPAFQELKSRKAGTRETGTPSLEEANQIDAPTSGNGHSKAAGKKSSAATSNK